MSEFELVIKRPMRSSFKDGRALHDIYDDHGVKWIAKGQNISNKQIEVALVKGSLTRVTRDLQYEFTPRGTAADLRPTYSNIVSLSNSLSEMTTAKTEDIAQHGRLTESTCELINKTTEDIMELMWSTQFSPFKLTGLTSFLYHESRFKSKRDHLKLLNNAGVQHMLFKGILTENTDVLVKANLINPVAMLEDLAQEDHPNERVILSKEKYQEYCQRAAAKAVAAIKGTSLGTPFLQDLVRYFSPLLYFTSPEARLFQQINMYTHFNLPGSVQEELPFTLSELPVINLSNYFKPKRMGGGLGMEGSRLVHYVGLIPAGTAIQFNNREKGLIIAPKNKDTLYCVIITGMDGQPLLTPSLREIHFRDLNTLFKIIPTHDLPLKYEEHSHEKIWKMHIVHENLKRLA